MSSGGGGGPTTTTVNQSNLPEYARPYYEGLLGSGLVQSATPWVGYNGDRVAGFNDFNTRAFGDVWNMGEPGEMQGASQFMGQTGNYASGVAAQANDQLNRTGNYQTGTFDYSRFIDPTNPQDYMSPYMRNVADITKREATRDFDIQQQGRDAQAVKSGAFGGYRQGIVDAEATRNLNQQLQDIDTQAQQSAYTNAQSQFNSDRAARLAQQQALEQSRQYGSNLGLSGLNTASGLIGQLGGLGTQMGGLGSLRQQLDLNRIGAVSAAGDTMRNANQQALDTGYGDFVEERDWGRNQLGFFNNLLRGMPIQPSTTTTQYNAPPNALSQYGGLGLAALGASQLK